tara:strand:- start:600 stop:1316 length:717 start_codon:yes stop_codon:yes gene_type:complete
MNKNYKKWIWGGLGWALIGPIGGILGFALGSLSQDANQYSSGQQTRGGDFLSAILVLFAAVMKADGVQKKSELDYIKRFLVQQVGLSNTRQLLQIFKNILKQNFSLEEVCLQIKQQMDKPSRLQLIHVLFGLSQADGEVHNEEIKVIKIISSSLGIDDVEYQSIQGMFKEDLESAYKVLGVSLESSNQDIKKAYRKMANKYHPDKIAHLGDDFKDIAQEKFKSVSEAYQKIKKDRDIK